MSYWMNRLQGLDAREDIFVTLNRTDSLDPEKVIEVIPYEHPIVTHEAVAAQRRWGEVSRAPTASTSAARTGAGAFTRTGAGARSGRASRSLRVARAAAVECRLSRSAGRRMTHSAIYEGWVRHRRHDPVEHEFRYPLFMAYLDLAELPWVLRRRIRAGRRGAPRSRASSARTTWVIRTGRSPTACARRSSSARARSPRGRFACSRTSATSGTRFNPVSFYYCFDEADERVESVLAEVTNTPWGERHSYLLGRAADRSA